MSVIGIMALPSLTFAAWYNPVSWFSFFFHREPQVIEKIVYVQATSTPATSTPMVAGTSTENIIEEKPTPKPVIKKTPVVDNSAQIKAQAALKLKAQQDAQAKAEAEYATQVKAAADLKAQQDAYTAQIKAQQDAKIKADQEQYQRDLEATKAREQAAYDQKQSQLDAINQKVANLNAKYAADLKALQSGDMTKEQSYPMMLSVDQQYRIDYAQLQAEFQQIKYSN